MNRRQDLARMILKSDRTTPNILMLEDSAVDAELIEAQLGALAWQPAITRVVTRNEFSEALAKGGFDIVLSDFSLPDFDGMAALDMAVAEAPDIPFIFVSGVLGEEAAIDAFRRGATDYVLKQRLIRLSAAVERALNEAHERRERRRVEMQKDLLVRELSHRVKNNLAIITSIIRRTRRGSLSVDEFQTKLLARIQAMADAHALLFEGNWEETALLDVFTRAVKPYDSNAARFDFGERRLVRLNPKTALAFAMIFNELITNAEKYGALSNDAGRIAVSWRVERDQAEAEKAVFCWRENHGPRIGEPEHEGFGSMLIRTSVQYELEGDLTLDYRPDGLFCEIRFPLDA
jgi:two-component sensor histidine kinase/CheY-like chemotaxis protein